MKRLLVLFLLAGVISCEDEPYAPGGDGELTIDPPDLPNPVVLLTHLNALAHDTMQGRRAGSIHEEKAAVYVRAEFQEYGLEPAVPGYLQEFTIPIPVDGQSGLESQNVLAVLPGSGELADQWVIVGAHYDHMGVGTGGVVYNGADDNGSGTALVLEAARYLSEYVEAGLSGERDRRSVMFQTYGAEEVGLIGSTYFCSNASVPLPSITAMVNLDMVGRLRQDTLILIGTSSSVGWQPLIEEAGGGQFDLIITDEAVNRSDQYCFFANGRPVMFVHTGTHAEYHTPADDVVTLNMDGMVRVGEFTIAALLDLMFRAEPLPAGGAAASVADREAG